MDDKNLSVTDLAVIKNIINLACTRGAFQASEMRTVGETYDRLSEFLDTIVAQADAAAAATNQGETQ